MFCLQNIFVIVCLKICHVAAFGLHCFGQVSVDVKDGFCFPVRGYFSILLPSEDVISERVRTCRYSLQLFSSFRVCASCVCLSKASIRKMSFFLCLDGFQ